MRLQLHKTRQLHKIRLDIAIRVACYCQKDDLKVFMCGPIKGMYFLLVPQLAKALSGGGMELLLGTLERDASLSSTLLSKSVSFMCYSRSP